MTRRQRRHPRALRYVGIVLLVAWNVGMLTLMVAAAQSYNSCVADGGIICFDLSGPIFLLMIVVDLVVGLIVGVVRMVRVRRARRLT
jgi:hypothetical protein